MAAELEGLIKLGAQRSRRVRWPRWRARAQLEAKRPRPVARPYPIKPAGELYAEILLGTGDATAAVVQFKAALARTPGRAASLLGLARAASVAGPRAGAAQGREGLPRCVASRGQGRPSSPRCARWHDNDETHEEPGTHERHETRRTPRLSESFVPTASQFRAFRGDRRDQTSSMTIFAHVEKEIEPAGPDRRVVHPQHDLVSAGRCRAPGVRPQAPRQRRRRHRAVVDPHPRLARLEPDRQRVGRRRPAPDDAGDPVVDAAADQPLLDAHRHRRGVDRPPG